MWKSLTFGTNLFLGIGALLAEKFAYVFTEKFWAQIL